MRGLRPRSLKQVLALMLLRPGCTGDLVQCLKGRATLLAPINDDAVVGALAIACWTLQRDDARHVIESLSPSITERSSANTIFAFVRAHALQTLSLSEHHLKVARSVDLGRLDLHDSRLFFRAMMRIGAVDVDTIQRMLKRMLEERSRDLDGQLISDFLWQSLHVQGASARDVEPLLVGLIYTPGWHQRFTGKQLRLAVSAANKIGVNGRARLRPFFETAVRLTHQDALDNQLPSWELSDLLMTLVTSRTYGPTTLQSLVPLCMRTLPKSEPPVRLQIQWAYAAASELSPPLFSELAKAEQIALHEHKPHGIATIAWAFAQLGQFEFEPLFERIATRSTEIVDCFDMRGLASIVWALSGYALQDINAREAMAHDVVVPLWSYAASRLSMADGNVVIHLLNDARLALLHTRCKLDFELARRVASLARENPKPRSEKKQFIYDQIESYLQHLRVGRVRRWAACPFTGLELPLVIDQMEASRDPIVIEVLLRPEFVNGNQVQMCGGALNRTHFLRHNGFCVVVVSEQDFLKPTEHFDRINLLVEKLQL